MVALRKQLFTAIFMRVVDVNSNDTEEALNMEIAENIIDKNIRCNTPENFISSVYSSEPDTGDILQDGVFVYKYNSFSDWTFEEYNSIAEAVREAVALIGAMIIYNGQNIVYSAIDEKSAYYIDEVDQKVKIVEL